jgi:alkaline phosphatase
MKRMITIALLMCMSVMAFAGNFPEKVKPTKNVIIMVPDGTSNGVLSAARWYQRYVTDVSYDLNLSDYICGLVETSSSNSPMSCSAAAMSTVMTGVSSKASYISAYPHLDPEQDIYKLDGSRTYQPLITAMEAGRLEKGKAIGIVVTTKFYHATPASCVAHTDDRNDSRVIAYQAASSKLDVMFGGGNKRVNDEALEILKDQGIEYIHEDVEAFRNYDKEGRVWALFNESDLSYDIDRDDTKEPSLEEMTRKAIERLSKDKDGFVLMVEGSQVDFAAHATDPIGIVSEFLAFDRAVGVAMDFAKKDGNTTVVVLPDHGTSGVTLGKFGYSKGYRKGLEKAYGDMKNFKASADKLTVLLRDCKPEEIRSIFKEWTGLDLTDKEYESLVENQGKQEGHYMEVVDSENLFKAIADIMSDHAAFGYSSGSHTGEDVFLAAYHPKGQIPTGIVTNVQVNEYICKALGLKKSLLDLSDEYFVDYTKVFAGMDCRIIEDKNCPKLVVNLEGKDIVIPGWRSYFEYDGKRYELPVQTVYMKADGKFYVPKDILSRIK